MPSNEPITQEQYDALMKQLDRVESLLRHGPEREVTVHPLAFWAWASSIEPGAVALAPEDWPVLKKLLSALAHPRHWPLTEALEFPAPPWKYLVARRHPWRKQLYIKGRNMTVRQLVGTVKANGWDIATASANLDLPQEAIQEAFAYAEQNSELLRIEGEIELLMLKRGGKGGGAENLSG